LDLIDAWIHGQTRCALTAGRPTFWDTSDAGVAHPRGYALRSASDNAGVARV